MAADHSPASTHTSKNRKKTITKADEKRALSLKRLAMLQDDHVDDAHLHIIPVPEESPKQHKGASTGGIREKSGANLSLAEEPILATTEGENTASDLKEDMSSGSDVVVVYSPSANRLKHGSRKRIVVISDDESEKDETKLSALIQPTKKERTKRPTPAGKDSLKREDFNVSAKPRKHSIMKIAKKSDNPSEELSPAMRRAKEIQANLSAQFPSFIKVMKPSHVTGCFWLGLPHNICDSMLPLQDSELVLVDEAGCKFPVKYLREKKGLSGGWRKFAIKHELREADVVVFQQIASTTFQIYIVRKDSADVIDGALGLLTLDTCARQPLPVESNDHALKVHNANVSPQRDSVSPNSVVDIEFDMLNGISFADSDITFESVKRLEDFKIIVKCIMSSATAADTYYLIIDSKFSDANKRRYYELCKSQKSFLHDQLLKGLNCNLIVGIILETINIADGIRACTRLTSTEDLKIWEKTLKAFKIFGMKVDFLLAKLHQLIDFDKENEPKRS